MISKENIEFLYSFYELLNNRNGQPLDFSTYKIDDGISYDFNEDVLEAIMDNLAHLNNSIEELKLLESSQPIEELVRKKLFVRSFVDIARSTSSLSHDFEEFHTMHVDFLRSLPQSPTEDSELVD